MPKFIYKAIKQNGSTISDIIEADNIETATKIIADRGFLPVKVNQARKNLWGSNLSDFFERLIPVKAPELILFTKQLRTMLRAGVPIIKLFQVLENQTENIRLKRVIHLLSLDVQEGASLHSAFLKHPRIFSGLYCSMIQAGEVSGALPEVLDRLIYIIEHENKIRSEINAALQYPLIVISFLIIAFFILLTFVIPKFVNIFVKAGLDLPVPTKISMFLYQSMTNYWYILGSFLIILITAVFYYLKTRQGQYVKDSLLLKIPLIGTLLIKAGMSRFASIFSILQASGVTVLEIMQILADTIGNKAIAKEFIQITDKLEEGRGIAEPLSHARYFTPIVINMIAIGEESGNLEEMLNEISIHYDSELEYAMKKLTDAIAPVLTIGLAFVVGFFALSIFLPMWDLTKMVK